MRVLVTGGTGTLGWPLVAALLGRAVTVRVLSRQPASAAPGGVEWARGDLVTGEGLGSALEGVDVVVHAAHDPRNRTRDVQGVRTVLDAAQRAGVGHVVYVSVVGARDVPGVPYYRGKAEAEALVAASPLDTSVFRATQFHDFLDGLLGRVSRLPALLVPRGALFQPVDVHEVAAALAEHALSAGRAPATLAGPEILALRDLALAWQAARRTRRPVVELPLPLPAGRALAAGALTAPSAPRGQLRWAQWLARSG